MGRKSIPISHRKVTISVTLPPHIVERVEIVTSHRSAWIRRAIEDRLNASDILQNASAKELILPLLTRNSLRSGLSEIQLAVLEEIYNDDD